VGEATVASVRAIPQQLRAYSEEDALTHAIVRGEWLFRHLVSIVGRDLGGDLLDIGCGYGGISLAWARFGKTAYALDIQPTNLEVLLGRIRSGEARSGQVLPLVGSALAIPLSDLAVDLVLMIGVLEWVGFSSAEEDVRRLQIRALREAWRVLRPGGLLVIGTKNRLYPRYVWRDSQLQKPILNILSRRAANWLSVRFGLCEYRGYIYSYWGWKRLLRAAGVDVFKVVVPVFNYQFPLLVADPWSRVANLGLQVSVRARALAPGLRYQAVEDSSRFRLSYYRLIAALGVLGIGAGTLLLICAKPGSE
jgi:SAM-dependent methyltransferase